MAEEQNLKEADLNESASFVSGRHPYKVSEEELDDILKTAPPLTVELQQQAAKLLSGSKKKGDVGLVSLLHGVAILDPEVQQDPVSGERVADAFRKILDVVDSDWRRKFTVLGVGKSAGYIKRPEGLTALSLYQVLGPRAAGGKRTLKRVVKRAEAQDEAQRKDGDV